TLTVYTYDSFVSEWGPGPGIEAAFEARCGDCDLEFVALPGSFAELLEAPEEVKVILQDPRTSVTGQGLMLWIKKLYGDRAPEIWARLNERVLAVTNGWSQAYFSLFMNGEAPMVLSYATSPAYHMAVEETDRYQAAAFEEGHYLQVETAAMLRTTERPELARDFLAFILTPAFQRHIPLGNIMNPAIDLGDALA
ncbi:MAG: thiamine ABC transporter substrate-binding protein, partial [Halomonas sp.]|nr:thiamine ABC transporter substrate-binding protein [Halomonas sp.]